jgi:hypothetical protein
MYSSAVQTVKGVHTLSEVDVGIADWNSDNEHVEKSWHCLAEVAVAAMDSY